MNGSVGATYRVYVEGMSPTERTAFCGMMRLAERNGSRFRMEAAFENTDIIVLDGTDRRSVAFAESHAQIAQRAIWVDPPAHVTPALQIKRPLRWVALLQLMEKIVGINRKPAAFDAPRQAAELTPDQMCKICEGVLRPHIGVAVEFVLDDVRAAIVKKGVADEPIGTDSFLGFVRPQLPSNVDAAGILQQISVAIAQGGNV